MGKGGEGKGWEGRGGEEKDPWLPCVLLWSGQGAAGGFEGLSADPAVPAMPPGARAGASSW